MGQLDLSGTMDELAEAAPGARSYAFPIETVEPPATIVGYPTEIEFDATFGRGSDRAVFPIWYVVGRVNDERTRDALSLLIAGVGSVKTALEAHTGTTYQTLRVTTATIERVTIAAVDMMAVRFDTEVIS